MVPYTLERLHAFQWAVISSLFFAFHFISKGEWHPLQIRVKNRVCVMCAAEFSSRQALSTSGVCHFTFIKLPVTVSHLGPPHAFVSLPINIFLYQRIAFLALGAFVGHRFWVCLCNCLCVCVHIVKSCFCKHTVSVERLSLCDNPAQTIDEDITRDIYGLTVLPILSSLWVLCILYLKYNTSKMFTY